MATVRSLLTDQEWAAARRTTLNAHYTDPDIVEDMWTTLTRLGFTGGPVLEPGCGSGNFIAAAPQTAAMIGVELDPLTAAIAAARRPGAVIRAESFAETRLPEASLTAVIGNVPFGAVALYDPVHNPGKAHTIHNHFLIKALHLTAPGGYVVAISLDSSSGCGVLWRGKVT